MVTCLCRDQVTDLRFQWRCATCHQAIVAIAFTWNDSCSDTSRRESAHDASKAAGTPLTRDELADQRLPLLDRDERGSLDAWHLRLSRPCFILWRRARAGTRFMRTIPVGNP